MCLSVLSRIRLFATPWSLARQAPLSMGFSGQEYWSGLPCPPPGDLPDPGTEPKSLVLAGGFFTSPGEQGAKEVEKHPVFPERSFWKRGVLPTA